jgi:hypothetical protein
LVVERVAVPVNAAQVQVEAVVAQSVAQQLVQLWAHVVLCGVGLALQPRQETGVDECNARFSASVRCSMRGMCAFHESTKKVKK